MTGSNIYIGCCGAYCKTCKPFIEGYCKGCKLGFETGERNIEKIKCKIKACCYKEKKLDTCADCMDLSTCITIGGWFSKKGYKYNKYKQAIVFIKENGYSKFIGLADKWSNAYGKYK
jgi:hypothetical protein